MKKISMLIFCLAAIIIFAGGCAVWKDLNTPVRKTRRTRRTSKPKPKAYEPETLPDGSTVGLNKYEKAYMDGFDKDFKRQQEINSRKVFGKAGGQ